ncbi:MAG: DUF1737 domain-containing protein [Candidatus Gracilibacteria bacterium]|nr:DUF1737 domain-containing protein [Candidatus Gracilibacteria bacterium]
MEKKFYIILSADTTKQLEESVNDKLNQGYKLVGGIAIDVQGKYVQAMKHKTNKKN